MSCAIYTLWRCGKGMFAKSARLVLLTITVAVVMAGCRGCMRENVVWEHTFNKPDCGGKPCPRECPEPSLPPGGPYTSHSRVTTQKTYAPEPPETHEK